MVLLECEDMGPNWIHAEGFILGVGAKMFAIAGPVIVYDVRASAVHGLICWITTLFQRKRLARGQAFLYPLFKLPAEIRVEVSFSHAVGMDIDVHICDAILLVDFFEAA